MAKTESVTAQMQDLLDEIDNEVQRAAEVGIQQVSKESAQKLQNTSPRKTGSYARGWTVKKDGKLGAIVHNKTDYQLTHLLENGHVIRNKKGTYGRAPGIKHIAPVEEWAVDELPRRIMEDIP